MAKLGKGKVLTGKSLKESQRQRELKGDRRPARNRQFTEELFTYKRGSVYKKSNIGYLKTISLLLT